MGQGSYLPSPAGSASAASGVVFFFALFFGLPDNPFCKAFAAAWSVESGCGGTKTEEG